MCSFAADLIVKWSKGICSAKIYIFFLFCGVFVVIMFVFDNAVLVRGLNVLLSEMIYVIIML